MLFETMGRVCTKVNTTWFRSCVGRLYSGTTKTAIGTVTREAYARSLHRIHRERPGIQRRGV